MPKQIDPDENYELLIKTNWVNEWEHHKDKVQWGREGNNAIASFLHASDKNRFLRYLYSREVLSADDIDTIKQGQDQLLAKIPLHHLNLTGLKEMLEGEEIMRLRKERMGQISLDMP